MKGFTLIELLLALVIVAFSVTALLSLFISSIFLDTANRSLTTAISHAQYALEYIKNELGLPGDRTWSWNSAYIKNNTDLEPLDDSEYINTTVAPKSSNVKYVNVTVSWKDRGIINRSIDFKTLIAGE